MCRWERKRSSILALSLWALTLLSVFGLYLSIGVRQKIALVKNLTFRDSLYYIADAGIKRGIVEIKIDEILGTDTLKESWSNNPAVFKDIKLGRGSLSVGYDFVDKGGATRKMFGLVDEERKININTANRKVLTKLFEVVLRLDQVQAQEIAASIIDWRDNDSFLSIPVGSAEDSYYRNLKESYDCKDSSFQALEELLLVKGINRSIFEQIKDFVTIYGEGSVNANTAPREVLLALGIDDLLADKIIDYRSGEDEIQGTSDDNVFTGPGNIVAGLSQFTDLASSEVALLSNIVSAGLLGTSSYNFTVRSTASIPGGLSKEIIAVVDRTGQIFSWRQF
ncbi:MAG: general secretion pathway protein GspK [Candidatus Omnitrophica bacterium]|nr:general secretion pathway protein GspK [Candidatus Omnitrophota bacterium]